MSYKVSDRIFTAYFAAVPHKDLDFWRYDLRLFFLCRYCYASDFLIVEKAQQARATYQYLFFFEE